MWLQTYPTAQQLDKMFQKHMYQRLDSKILKRKHTQKYLCFLGETIIPLKW